MDKVITAGCTVSSCQMLVFLESISLWHGLGTKLLLFWSDMSWHL